MSAPAPATTPPRPAAAAPRLRIVRVLARLALYLGACWGTLAVLADSALPHGAWYVAALAALTTLPIVAFAVWRGWRFYPISAFRLFVLRPFWYTQLLLPIVAGAGLLGILVGAPFGAALAAGRAAAVEEVV